MTSSTRNPHRTYYRNPPALERTDTARFRLRGWLAERLRVNRDQWLLTAPSSNPSMLQIFRDRDREPYRDLVPWAGEFAGKYLLSGVQALRLTQDTLLFRSLQSFVAELVSTQHESGYLGPFPTSEGMIGKDRWDLWGQYHVMLGLYEWWCYSREEDALRACKKAADHFCNQFLGGEKRVLQAGWEEMNESCIHIFTLLYADFGEPRYLELIREIEKDWEAPPSGDYVRTALEGTPFYKTPKPRWESLHSVQAISELAFLTGDAKYQTAYEQIWWSIVEGDRHNTGGFSSGEQATGNPYDPGAIETCCTIAWMAVTIDMLRLSGDSRAGDELELSLYNAVLGSQHPSGRWWTYNTPMDGDRKASAHEIVFQARAGSSELNCCSVNAPRGIGCLADWALLTSEKGVALNYYGAGSLSLKLASGNTLSLEQKTQYPLSGAVKIVLSLEQPEAFRLSLRIPAWSHKTEAALNGEPLEAVRGSYLQIDRQWKTGDTLSLHFDMSLRLWVGEAECSGKVALYWGALLLAYDPRFDSYSVDAIPEIDLTQPIKRIKYHGAEPRPQLLLSFGTKEGGRITLCDYATAGACGTRYRSWLEAGQLSSTSFQRENALRCTPIAFKETLY